MNSNYEILKCKLDNFKMRYYFNLLIKGILIVAINFFILTIFFSILEFVGYFSSIVRTILYFSFLLINLYLLSVYIFIPLTALLKIRKIIDDEGVGEILGKFFKKQIKDKIINAVQLDRMLKNEGFERELLIACIEQKSKELIIFPFKKAIDLKKNKIYLYPAISLMIIFLTGWFFIPEAFQLPARRIINYNVEFIRPAPFEIIIMNEYPLKGYINKEYVLEVSAVGEILPTDIKIVYDDTKIQMVEKDRGIFNYRFRNLYKNIGFRIEANGFLFGPYVLIAENKATIKDIVLFVEYPNYTGIENEKILNITDIEIPEGSLLKWTIFTDFAEKLYIEIKNNERDKEAHSIGKNGMIELEKIVHESEKLTFSVVSANGLIGDSLFFDVNIIKDQYPEILVEDFQDSVYMSRVYFQGLISDDYGFSGLKANYLITKGNIEEKVIVPIEIDNSLLSQDFYHWIDINTVGLGTGDQIKVFFEVADNDSNNGFKRSISNSFYYRIPEINELISQRIHDDQIITSNISKSINSLNILQNEIDNLRREILNTDNVSWEQRERLKNLLDKQNKLMEENEFLNRITEENVIKEQQFRQINNEILKKQEELQSLINEVLTDEMKELFQKIKEELEKLDRTEVFKMLEKMEFELSGFENRLDRALELFKRLQVERLMEEGIKAIEKIEEEQVKLNQNLIESGITNELRKDQEKIKDDFMFARDILNNMREKNEALRRPNMMESTKGKEEIIERDIDQSINELRRENHNRANDAQNQIIKGLENLGKDLREMRKSMQIENIAEDIRSLRIILDNLMKTSFAQENLIEEFNFINLRDPKYVELIREQRKIREDLVLIQDSLKSLASRQLQIQSFVNKEINEIKFNIEESIDHLINRRKNNGVMRQQYVMTHVNNLALLLNESLKNMKSMMQDMENGMGKTGEGEEYGFQDLRELQEQMNKMLEQLQEGHKPIPGQGLGKGMEGISEQLARMAAEQEAIRMRLNELAGERNRIGEDTGDLEDIMKEMENTEIDILTNNVNRKTQLRQQQILTRLLEHERAEMERELDENRVGETAKSYNLSNPNEILEYNRVRNRDIEMIRKVPPSFRSHYRSISKMYFLNVD